MKYTVKLTKRAQKVFKKLDTRMKNRIFDAIGDMIDYYDGKRNVAMPDVKTLRGKFEGLLRLRVGDYRVIFSMHNDELIILVVDIAPRGGAYK
ncbi:addiction module toxin RelE [Marinitoga sp. 1137]|uniref:type II toxin-antitoxin system RelE family toxin n=1 Tax=Marinitoga sp. 1137 TaxID=1545835 RepID=UPI0009508A44|nr:type II toxin-antitoxin system RelE/ParE family toxin [Marinitoga sp. 1137]APT75692.1 addiction module toxin RelE [Marinitoga sp. 1137]